MKEDTTQIDSTWMEKTGGYAKDMTLRDHFAGLAMQGLLSRTGLDKINVHDVLVQRTYAIADAMLEERSK